MDIPKWIKFILFFKNKIVVKHKPAVDCFEGELFNGATTSMFYKNGKNSVSYLDNIKDVSDDKLNLLIERTFNQLEEESSNLELETIYHKRDTFYKRRIDFKITDLDTQIQISIEGYITEGIDYIFNIAGFNIYFLDSLSSLAVYNNKPIYNKKLASIINNIFYSDFVSKSILIEQERKKDLKNILNKFELN